jgi:hypothetical protein
MKAQLNRTALFPYKDTGLDAPRPKFEADAKLEAAGLSTNASSILVTLSKVCISCRRS